MKVINTSALYLDLLEDLSRDRKVDEISIMAKETLKRSLLKKFIDNVNSEITEKPAVEKFLSVNERCRTWQLSMSDLRDELLVGHFRQACHRFFDGGGDPLIQGHWSILDAAALGPGKSLGSQSNDFYTKLFDSKLSCTSIGLYRLYRSYISTYPIWKEADDNRTTTKGLPDVVKGNRLSFVPKDATISRSICVEPVLNMFYQLGIGRIIEERLFRKFGIDLGRQPDVNRRLAVQGSLQAEHSSSERLVTIDLSSASDSLSLKMLREFLPSSLLDWLELARCPVTSFNGQEIELHMVSTMGNGFTFPLETALFSCVVVAAMELDQLERRDNSREPANLFFSDNPNWGVFGDDIIVPYRVSGKVLRLLALLGFEVNHDKTYLDGSFKESCGVDAFHGINVRGVYLKTLRTPQDRYSAVNRLNEWSFRTGICLPKTIVRLLRGVPRFCVPLWENEDCGVRVTERLLRLVSTRPIWRSKNGSYLYKRYVPRSLSMEVTENEIRPPGGKRARSLNEAGALLAFLQGTIVNGSIMLRPKHVRYTTKAGVAPNWEFHPTVRPALLGGGGQRGGSHAVEVNITSSW